METTRELNELRLFEIIREVVGLEKTIEIEKRYIGEEPIIAKEGEFVWGEEN